MTREDAPRFTTRAEVNSWLEVNRQPQVTSPLTEVARNLTRAVQATPTRVPNWQVFLGDRTWKEENHEFLRVLTERYRATMTDPGFVDPAVRWWNQVYVPTQRGLLDRLQPAAVRRDVVRVLLSQERNPTQRTVLERLLCAEPPVYNRTSSRTGRMVVRGGPDFTVLRHEYRDRVLQSRWGSQGSLWELDYNALEPRTLLALRLPLLGSESVTIPQAGNQDLYLLLQNSSRLSSSSSSREDWKRAVISTLYGAKPANPEMARFLETTFMTPEWAHWTEQQISLFFGQKLHSYHGRPIWVTDTEDNTNKEQDSKEKLQQQTANVSSSKLLNWLTQSTAVDVALLGFKNVVEKIKEQSGQETRAKVVPVFVIHDSLWLDVHNSQAEVVPSLCEAGSTGILGLEGVRFPMRARRLGGRKEGE